MLKRVSARLRPLSAVRPARASVCSLPLLHSKASAYNFYNAPSSILISQNFKARSFSTPAQSQETNEETSFPATTQIWSKINYFERVAKRFTDVLNGLPETLAQDIILGASQALRTVLKLFNERNWLELSSLVSPEVLHQFQTAAQKEDEKPFHTVISAIHVENCIVWNNELEFPDDDKQVLQVEIHYLATETIDIKKKNPVQPPTDPFEDRKYPLSRTREYRWKFESEVNEEFDPVRWRLIAVL